MAKNINRTVTIYINGREVENTLQSIRNEVTKLEREQRKLPIGSEEYIKKGEEIAELKKILLEQKTNVADLGNTWEHTTQKMAEYSNILMGVQSAFQMLDLGIGKVKDLAKAAAELDDAYGQVMKTTGLTHDEVEQLNELFKKMDTRTSREQLNELAYEAGKLGIQGVKDVAAFVDASDKINVALGDVLGNGAMVTIGKMAQVYAGSTDELAASTGNLQKQMLAIGSAVNELGKLSTANEHYLVDFAGRMGGIAVQAGLSADQILGFASALDQDMQKVEMSATAFQKFIGQIMKKPEEFAKQAGMAVSDFAQLVRTDLNEALFRVLQGFSGKGGYAELVNIFKDLGLDGARAASVISAMSNSIDKIKVAQAAANEQLKSGESIMGEYETMNNTLQAQSEKAKKRFEEVRIELGNELYPVLISLQRSGTVLMKGVAGVAQLLKKYPVLIAPIIAGLIAWNRYRIVSIVTSGRLVNALKTVTGIKKIEAAATAFQAKSDAKLRAEEEASRLQTLKNQLAIEKENLARQKSKVGMEAQSLALTNEAAVKKMETAVTNQATVAEQAHANAIKATRAARMAMPWGMIIMAITAIIGGLAKMRNSLESIKLNKFREEVETEVVKTQRHIDVLFEKLRKLKEGTGEYKEALDELVNTYPNLMNRYVDEEGRLRSLEQAYIDVSNAAKKSIYDRIAAEKSEEAYAEAAKTVADSLDKIKSKLKSAMDAGEISPDDANKALKYLNQLAAGIKDNTDALNAMHKAEQYLLDLGMKNHGNFLGYDVYNTKKDAILTALSSIGTAMQKAKDQTESFNRELGISEKKAENPDPYNLLGKSSFTLQRMLKKAEDESKNLNKQIDAVKKQLAGPLKRGERSGFEQKLNEYEQKAGSLKSKIEAIKKALGIGSDSNKVNNDDDNKPADNSKETPAQRKARLAREAKEAESNRKAWDKAQKDAEKMIRQYKLKAESGLQKVKDDVDQKTAEIVERLKATAEAAGESSEDLEKRLSAAAEEYKKTKVEEYLASVNKEIDRLRKNTAKSGDNKMLDKVSQATEKLRQKLNNIDIQINKLQADKRLLEGKADKDSKKLLEEIEEKIKELGDIRSAAISSAYSNIKDFDIENPFESTDTLSFSQNKAKALEEVERKAREYEKSLNDAIEAEEELARVAGENGDHSAAVEHQANAAALKEEAAGLDELREEAEKLARFDALSETLKKWCDKIQQFSDQAVSIFSNINTLLDNMADSELQKMEREKDEAIENLDEQLEQGLISQEDYNEQKEALDKEYEAKEKEKELEQWKRQKALDYTQAIINGALAAVRAYAEGGPYLGPALAAMVAAATGIEIAAIASQPEPYAKGGFVPRRTVYQAGEAGPEWVASNTLLSDPATAPIIEKLEDYQRGNRHALADIPMAQLDFPAALSASEQIGRNHVVVQPQSAAAVWEHPTAAAVGNDSREMVNLMRELVTYEKDPRNRQAVISRRTMDDFNNNENFLRNRARL